MRRRQAAALLLLLAVAGTALRPAAACTTLLVGKNATTDGSMFLARTVDYAATGVATNNLRYHPARTVSAGLAGAARLPAWEHEAAHALHALDTLPARPPALPAACPAGAAGLDVERQQFCGDAAGQLAGLLWHALHAGAGPAHAGGGGAEQRGRAHLGHRDHQLLAARAAGRPADARHGGGRGPHPLHHPAAAQRHLGARGRQGARGRPAHAHVAAPPSAPIWPPTAAALLPLVPLCSCWAGSSRRPAPPRALASSLPTQTRAGEQTTAGSCLASAH